MTVVLLFWHNFPVKCQNKSQRTQTLNTHLLWNTKYSDQWHNLISALLITGCYIVFHITMGYITALAEFLYNKLQRTQCPAAGSCHLSPVLPATACLWWGVWRAKRGLIKEHPIRGLLLLLLHVVYWSKSGIHEGCIETALGTSCFCTSLGWCGTIFYTLWCLGSKKKYFNIFFFSFPSPHFCCRETSVRLCELQTWEITRNSLLSWNLPFMVAPQLLQAAPCVHRYWLSTLRGDIKPPSPDANMAGKDFPVKHPRRRVYFKKLNGGSYSQMQTNKHSTCTHTMPSSRNSLNILLPATWSHPSSSPKQWDTTTKTVSGINTETL